MSNQSKGRKISEFLGQSSIPSDAQLTYISSGVNYKISLADFLSSIGVTGTIVQDGDPLGTPILDTAGSVNNIRNLESGAGIKTSVSVLNGATIEHNFQADIVGAQLVNDLSLSSPTFRSLVAGAGINVAQSGNEIQITLSATPASTRTVIVNSINDFPAAVAGVITLADNTEYAIRNNISTSNRFVMGDSTVLTGSDAMVVALSYTGTGIMFTSVNKSWTARRLAINCTVGAFIDFDGTGTEIFQVADCSINASILGTINDFSGIHFNSTQLVVTTNGFLFGGTNGVILLESNLSSIDAGILYDLGTATFDGFSVSYAFVTLNGTSVFLDGAASSANITTGNIGSVISTRFFGAGTPLNTIAVGDKRWEFSENNGIKDTSKDVLMSQVSNATVTAIAVANTPVKLSGAWTEEEAIFFTTDATGKITYTGEKDTEFMVAMALTVSQVSGTNKNIALYVAKNGAVITNSGSPAVIGSSTNAQRITVIWRVSLSENDYIEVFVENRTDAIDVLVTDAVMGLSD